MPVQQAYQHTRTRRPGPVDPGTIPAPNYDALVIGAAPWGYWKMNEASGSTITDYSGSARHGSVVGTLSMGQSGWSGEGTSIGFSANVANYINIASTSDLTSTDKWTWEALVNYTSGDGVVASRGTGSTDAVHAMEVASATELRVFNWSEWASVSVPSISGAWHHIAMTWDNPWRHIYLDGVEIGTGSFRSIASWASGPIYIGRTIGSGLPFNGKIQKVAYYTRALAAAEIAAHFASLAIP